MYDYDESIMKPEIKLLSEKEFRIIIAESPKIAASMLDYSRDELTLDQIAADFFTVAGVIFGHFQYLIKRARIVQREYRRTYQKAGLIREYVGDVRTN